MGRNPGVVYTIEMAVLLSFGVASRACNDLGALDSALDFVR
jgi:hypothetical protein